MSPRVSIETAQVVYVQHVRTIGQFFMEILYFKELGDTESMSRMQFGCLSSQILKKSDNWLWRYRSIAFKRFGGIQKVALRMQLF